MRAARAPDLELRVDVDSEPQMTQVHRVKADACIHAATLEDRFQEKGGV